MCVTRLNCRRDMMPSNVWRGSFVCVTWCIHMRVVVIRSYVCHDSFVCVTWLICTRDMTPPYVCCESFVCVTRRIHMCDVTHSYVAWLFNMCDVTRSYVWCDAFIFMTCLIPMCTMTDSFIRVYTHVYTNESRLIFLCVTWLFCMCDLPNPYVWRAAFMCMTYGVALVSRID